MKKQVLLYSCIFIFSISFLFNGCGSDNPSPEGSWSETDKQSHDQAIYLQDEIGDNLDDWFQTMDSLDAINKAYHEFVNSENVSSATINSQGIAVQYKNGMRGGLFLNPKDDKSEVGEFEKQYPVTDNEDGLKSLVNQKKMILINPHYFERSYYTDQIYSISRNNLKKVNIDLNTFYKNAEATVDRFTQLSGYGIIQIYSHGWAWPKQENITDVYLLTGETANTATSAKYWDELKTGNIPVMKVAGPNKYLVSPKFIRDHNDFSKDTVLFFGGFCYSFLGDWPDLIDDFADGAYTGYDWSVYTHKNANWSVNSIFNLSDTTAEQPVTLNDWFNKTDVEKSYWNEKDNRTVHIHYVGDGNLKLWDDISVSLIVLSADGAPVSTPGKVGTAYPFRCQVNSASSDLEFVWDIGDGSSPVSANNEVNITWGEEGTYQLSVTVKKQATGEFIGTARKTVTIGSETNNEIIDILKQCDYTVVYFDGNAINHWDFADCSWTIDGLLQWNGLNFSGSSAMNGLTKTINGSVSSDGQRISFTVVKEGDLLGYNQQIRLALTVENFPLLSYVYNEVRYQVDPPGGTNYVTNLEGYITSGSNTYNFTNSDFNWNALDEFYIRFNKP